MTWVALVGSIVMTFFFFFIYCLTSPASPIVQVESAMADAVLYAMSSPVIILFIIISTVVALSFDMLYKV